MDNNLDNAKEYLLKTNYEFFTQSEQNVIAKTMVPYAKYIFRDNIEILEKQVSQVVKNLSTLLQSSHSKEYLFKEFLKDIQVIQDEIRLMKR